MASKKRATAVASRGKVAKRKAASPARQGAGARPRGWTRTARPVAKRRPAERRR